MDLSEEESAPLVTRDRGGSRRSSSSDGPGLQVHLYFLPETKGETTMRISPGLISAEQVCIQAGKRCGILPVYQSVFGLASADLSCWFPPSHMFNPEENLQVHFRVRFFFGIWFGQGPGTSSRFSLTRDRTGPVLDCSAIDYLFTQLRGDFIASALGVSPPPRHQEEVLGLAVLDLWRMAKERQQSIRELCRTVSYKSCLPVSHRHDIQRRNRLDRYRIRTTLRRFLKKLGGCSVDERSLKLKYLIELAGVVPSLGSETFPVKPSPRSRATFSLLKVTWERGIETGGARDPDGGPWNAFCAFEDIVDIGVNRVCRERVPPDSRMVTITLEDRRLEADFQSLPEALSFVSLVDGYFRLTTDSSHYFCQSIAPPSLLEALQSHCHGPITSEFAVNKLRKSGFKGGTFLIRQSPKSYDHFFLTVCVQTPLGLDYKDCLIIKNEHFHLPGVQKAFSSLKELSSFYQHHKLLLADVPVRLAHCCPPQHKELTNLIIVGHGGSAEAPPTPERNRFSHIQFHMIKYEDLEWGESLGQGSFTRNFKGSKAEVRDGEKVVTPVFLKELAAEHQNCWEAFFEAASLMSQISHRHLVQVYGVSVHGLKNIMVQEWVECGALDLYLKRRSSVSVSWRLDVAKQLASALHFLEEKNIVHGNICAKNLLLAREDDQSQGSAPLIKLSDPGIGVSALGEDVILDRIPWVAPELLEAPDRPTLACDKWSFGATVWEIFNSGTSPLRGWDLDQKRGFYQRSQQLPASQWTELAELVHRCMDYRADFRPSSRSVIRQLNSLITSDYVILHASELVTRSSGGRSSSPAPEEQVLFEERHLRFISSLGKLVAVKKLQPNRKSTLEDFRKEVHTLSVFQCDYIVQYRGVCYSTGRLSMSLVMEYLPYGSLIVYLESHRQVDTRRMLLFASQICSGMEYLQTLRYVHRDLAARNILVANEALVKIADFGLTKFIPSDKEYYRVLQPGESPVFWYAPESISESRFSHKSDVWSFGVVLHELFCYCDTSCSPKRLYLQEIGLDLQSPSISMHLENILRNDWRLPAPLSCPHKVYSLMKQCWAFDFQERPCFSSLGEQLETIEQEERERERERERETGRERES
ncbi:tyrosine-protein kinase JAK2 [Pseudoliparis swirei]|uniref:tyrosine-protein kinase JAK2 n=1 Tax=Pseudoliparis swirei TaxID=2059687 RepID=UPI0024BE78E4|nr:tyrosine-protein kinase JAK2 [Pseudoliparis swirei]